MMTEEKRESILKYEKGADSVLSKLGTGGRVKYTCLDCSVLYLVFGANTGTLYFFERESLKLLSLISSKEIREPLSTVKLSPKVLQNSSSLTSSSSTLTAPSLLNPSGDSSANAPILVALSTLKGTVFILEVNLNSRKEKEKILMKYSHKEPITNIQWDEDGETVFFSDNEGSTYSIIISKARTTIFSDYHPELIHKCDSTIVQLSYSHSQLLISSLSRATVINSQKQSLQVGGQPRNGKYGACFMLEKKDTVLAARPGKRIWLADSTTGKVLQTLSFKDSLNLLPTPLLPQEYSSLPSSSDGIVDMKTLNFSKLNALSKSLLLAWEPNALFLIDLENIRIISWHVDIQNIIDLSIYENAIFILHAKTFTKLVLPTTSSAPTNSLTSSSNSIQNTTLTEATTESKDSNTEHDSKLSSSADDKLISTSYSSTSSSPSEGLMMPVDLDDNKKDSVVGSLESEPDFSPSSSPSLSANTATYFDNTNEAFPAPETAFPAPVSVPLKKSSKVRKKRKPAKIPEILSVNTTSLPKSTSISDIAALADHRSTASSLTPSTASLIDKPTHVRSKSGSQSLLTASHDALTKSLDSYSNTEEHNPAIKESISNPLLPSTKDSSEQLTSFGKMIRDKVATQIKNKNFRQIGNLIKDPFSKSESNLNKTSENSPEFNTRNSLSDAPSRSESTRSEDTSFYALTKVTYDALSQYRRDKERSVSSLMAIISHWISRLNTELQQIEENATSQDVNLSAPSSWIIEILTTYLELKLSKEGDAEPQDLWNEEDTKNFLNRYYPLLHQPRVLFTCNHVQFQECIELLFEKEDQSLKSSQEHEKVRESIESYIEDGDVSAALSIIRKKSNLSLILRYLGKLFELDAKATADYCIIAFPGVQPWNVERYAAAHPAAYLHYLTQIMKTQPECRKNAQLVEQWFEYNLKDSPPALSQLYDNNHIPLCNAHKVQWNRGDTLDDIIQHPDVYTYNTARVKSLCEEYGYFRGLTALHIRSADTLKAIDIILQTDDLESFHVLMSDNIDINEWKYLLTKMEQLYQDEDELEIDNNNSQQRAVSRDVVATKMIFCVGVTKSLELLLERSKFTSGLSHSVYKSFIQKGRIEEEQKTIIHEILENIDSYLWSARSPAIPPQLRALLDAEINNQLDTVCKPFLQRTQSVTERDRYEFKFDHTVPLPQFYEEVSGHWGTVAPTSQAKCSICTLPIKESLGAVSNIVVFQCGHSFHEFCVASYDACTTCVASNMGSLLD